MYIHIYIYLHELIPVKELIASRAPPVGEVLKNELTISCVLYISRNLIKKKNIYNSKSWYCPRWKRFSASDNSFRYSFRIWKSIFLHITSPVSRGRRGESSCCTYSFEMVLVLGDTSYKGYCEDKGGWMDELHPF